MYSGQVFIESMDEFDGLILMNKEDKLITTCIFGLTKSGWILELVKGI